VRIMHAKFQHSSFNGVRGRGGGGGREKDGNGKSHHIANFPLASLRRENDNCWKV